MRMEELEGTCEQRKTESSLGSGRQVRRAVGLGGWQQSAEDVRSDTTKLLQIQNGISARKKTAEEVRKWLGWMALAQ